MFSIRVKGLPYNRMVKRQAQKVSSRAQALRKEKTRMVGSRPIANPEDGDV